MSESLNPYCNGRYSWRELKIVTGLKIAVVLILIVMEDTLGDRRRERYAEEFLVLILIVMEDTLGVQVSISIANSMLSLNPYCCGRNNWRVLASGLVSSV